LRISFQASRNGKSLSETEDFLTCKRRFRISATAAFGVALLPAGLVIPQPM
jgi:hypothetical protein